MDRDHLQKIFNEKKTVVFHLERNTIFTGIIKSMGLTSIIILDKYGEEIPVRIDSIIYVDTERKKRDVDRMKDRQDGEKYDRGY